MLCSPEHQREAGGKPQEPLSTRKAVDTRMHRDRRHPEQAPPGHRRYPAGLAALSPGSSASLQSGDRLLPGPEPVAEDNTKPRRGRAGRPGLGLRLGNANTRPAPHAAAASTAGFLPAAQNSRTSSERPAQTPARCPARPRLCPRRHFSPGHSAPHAVTHGSRGPAGLTRGSWEQGH